VLDGLRIRGHIDAEHGNAAAVWPDQAGDHAQEGGLAGAVRPDQRRPGPGANLQRDAIDGAHGLAIRSGKGPAHVPGEDRIPAHGKSLLEMRTVTGWPSRSRLSVSSTMTRTS